MPYHVVRLTNTGRKLPLACALATVAQAVRRARQCLAEGAEARALGFAAYTAAAEVRSGGGTVVLTVYPPAPAEVRECDTCGYDGPWPEVACPECATA